MQFHIRTLLVVTLAVSLLCGIVFAAPPIVCIPVLCTILWVCPAVWVNGIVFGRGAWRAFFIGGFMAGLGPHIATLYYSFIVAAAVFNDSELDDLAGGDGQFPNLITAALLLAPGLFAFLGGITGMTTYWVLQPTSDKRTAQPPKVDEYLIVSGRLTTLPAPPETPRI